jgi:hypothetical protein
MFEHYPLEIREDIEKAGEIRLCKRSKFCRFSEDVAEGIPVFRHKDRQHSELALLSLISSNMR